MGRHHSQHSTVTHTPIYKAFGQVTLTHTTPSWPHGPLGLKSANGMCLPENSFLVPDKIFESGVPAYHFIRSDKTTPPLNPAPCWTLSNSSFESQRGLPPLFLILRKELKNHSRWGVGCKKTFLSLRFRSQRNFLKKEKLPIARAGKRAKSSKQFLLDCNRGGSRLYLLK